MNFIKKISCIAFLLCAGFSVRAQQDPQYSQYMFNQMAINPAYAGSREALNTVVLMRHQWTGIDGAPNTQTFTIHGPLRKKKVGLGFSVIADQIGPKKSIGALASYAYRIPLKKGNLSFGLRFGMYQYVYDWSKIIKIRQMFTTPRTVPL